MRGAAHGAGMGACTSVCHGHSCWNTNAWTPSINCSDEHKSTHRLLTASYSCRDVTRKGTRRASGGGKSIVQV